MVTLEEIEKAASQLSLEEKQRLVVFLAAEMNKGGNSPQPRQFSKERIETWVRQDEDEFRRFKESR